MRPDRSRRALLAAPVQGAALAVARRVALPVIGALVPVAVARSMGVDAAVFIEPDAPPRALHAWRPAGGSLERHSSRVGAWYALAWLPMAPGWPVELQVWSSAGPGHVRLVALDEAPDDRPSFAVALPLLEAAPARPGRPGPAATSRFRLPAGSFADGLFVLVEQWHADFSRPRPLWLHLRSHVGPEADARTPWWEGPPQAAGSSGPGAPSRPVPGPPPSPLTQELRDGRAGAIFELPAPAGRPRPYR